MKYLVTAVIACHLLLSAHAQTYKPYILATESASSIDALKTEVVEALKSEGLKVLGDYRPASSPNRHLIVFTAPDLTKAVQKVGGLTGFAGALRVGLTREGNKTIVSYTNPPYWGNAYFREDYPKVSANYDNLNAKLQDAMKKLGNFNGKSFGSEKGLTVKDLRKYHYMMGMPYFDDTEELEEFSSYREAKSKVDASIKKGTPHVKMVYQLEFPEKELCLYGFALSGPDGEEKFLPTIDIGTPKHTCFLPYEILIKGNEVHMLHGRFRIALSFPDLTMGTFSKIMSTPGDIEDLLEQLVE